MNALEVIQRFIDAFNRHDADAVNALLRTRAVNDGDAFRKIEGDWKESGLRA